MLRYFLLVLCMALFMGNRTSAQRPASKEELQAKFWAEIKEGLRGQHGTEYWSAMEGASLPGGFRGIDMFEGTLVSSKPADHPSEFLVALGVSEVPEVMLKLKGRLEKPLPPGTPITFEGVVKAYTRDPFQVTFEVETVNRAKVDEKPVEEKRK